MSKHEASFNLLDKPFVFATDAHGLLGEYSLLELFQKARELKVISGSSPLQELPIMRLLLAILYRALPNEVSSKQSWLKLWREGIPMESVVGYLERYRQRFDLLSTTEPFYQIANSEYEQPKANAERHMTELFVDAAKVMSVQIQDQGPASISFAEGARRLLEFQGYRTASRKSRLVGDAHVAKAFYAQLGWLGNGSFVLLSGGNLEQTLLLNLVPYGEGLLRDIDQEADKPLWELPQQTAAPVRMLGDLEEYGAPTGPCDLFTFQPARIQLHHDGQRIIDVRAGVGDRIFKYDQNRFETMTAWREIDRESGKKAWVPVRNNRDVWRSLSSLLAQNSFAKNGQQKAPNLAFFQVVEEAVEEQLTQTITLKTFQAEYGAQDAVIVNTVVSSLGLPPSLLDLAKFNHLDVAFNAASMAEKVARAVRNFDTDLLVASGKERKPGKGVAAAAMTQDTEDRALHTFESLYQFWLTELEADPGSWLSAWRARLRTAGWAQLDELAAAAPTSSLSGRYEQVGKKDSLVNYGIALRKARMSIGDATKEPQKDDEK